MSSRERDPQRRESPAGRTVKSDVSEATAQATSKQKSAEGRPAQEGPRQNDVRVSNIATRSHKSIRRLTGSPRDDSREQVYSALAAWPGQRHE